MFVVLCNVPPADEARISEALVGQGLAACVNALPEVRSTYLWQGAVVREIEVTLLIKVAAERVEALTEALRGMHPYTTPEILVLPVDLARSDPRYVAWVRGGR